MKQENKKLIIISAIVVAIVIVFAIVAGMISSKNSISFITLECGAYVPEDVEIIESSIEKGIVIKDSKGNEWVWIEVPKDTSEVYKTAGLNIKKFTEEELQKIRFDLKNYVSDIKKPDNPNQGDDYWIQLADDGVTYSKYDPLVGSTYDKKSDFLKRTKGCGVSYWEYSDTYKKMLRSIYENGGFYIGRYETGVKDAKSEANVSDNSIPVVQPDVVLYDVNLPKAVELGKKIATKGLTSSVAFNIQWDLALKHISLKIKQIDVEQVAKDSKIWGNYKNHGSKTITSSGALQATFDVNLNEYKWSEIKKDTKTKDNILLSSGACEEFAAMNIYDMAGNIDEFTFGFTEDYSPYSKRGGKYTNKGGSSASDVQGTTFTGTAGFRCALFK